MPKLYLSAALALLLTSCDAMTKLTTTSLKGTYRRIDKLRPFQRTAATIQFTTTKATMSAVYNQSFDYKLEDGYVYVDGGDILKTRFLIVSPDTLRNEGTPGLEGTYVRVSQ
jgi:hypothetical protein